MRALTIAANQGVAARLTSIDGEAIAIREGDLDIVIVVNSN
jgi:hypothetical protein